MLTPGKEVQKATEAVLTLEKKMSGRECEVWDKILLEFSDEWKILK